MSKTIDELKNIALIINNNFVFQAKEKNIDLRNCQIFAYHKIYYQLTNFFGYEEKDDGSKGVSYDYEELLTEDEINMVINILLVEYST